MIVIPQFGIASEWARKASCVRTSGTLEMAVAMWARTTPARPTSVAVQRGRHDPNYTALTGSVLYATPGTFKEPDDTAAANSTGADYYTSHISPRDPRVEKARWRRGKKAV